jgi:hypothetical protein
MRRLALLLLVALASCVQAPLFPTVAPFLPPLAPDQARIFFYREWEVSEGVTISPRIFLNGTRAGDAVPGGVFYRDVPAPQTYYITVDTEGFYWNPFKTVALEPGDTLFVKIESLSSWASGLSYQRPTFVVAIIPPEQAEQELSGMRYVQRQVE